MRMRIETPMKSHPLRKGESARVAILWRSLPEYISRCVEELARHDGVQLLVVYQTEGAFGNILSQLGTYPNMRVFGPGDPAQVLAACLDFKPDLAVISLARKGLFKRLARAWRKSDTLVIAACDHFWKGDWRDQANRFISKFGWFSAYEAILVPGALGKIYARKLGFPEQNIFEGMYTCNTEIFRPVGLKRHAPEADAAWPPVFLFVGQFIHRKGLDILLKAYQDYRRQASHPWELWLVGRGDLEKDLPGVPGVRNLGMKSSAEIAEIMLQSGCFVIPSQVDHWPLVIHEAASAGLPVLASNMCGSAVELVQPGFNGYVFPVNDSAGLAKFLLFMDESGAARKMGESSLLMASRFSPQLWARRILVDIPVFMRGQPLVT